jgi:septum formation protein
MVPWGITILLFSRHHNRSLPAQLILGSRSPQRRELLELLAFPEPIETLPPSRTEELPFDGITTWPPLLTRLRRIAQQKNEDVCRQLVHRGSGGRFVVTADTIIVVGDPAARLQVLGQPPDVPDWRAVVRGWFVDHYAGRSHVAATAVCITDHRTGQRLEQVVQTQVWFREEVGSLLDWYLQTEEPRGKAGGYAIQGLGSVFVTRVEGSLSNVIGLPLEATRQMLQALGWTAANGSEGP